MRWVFRAWLRVQLVRHIAALVNHARVRRFLSLEVPPTDVGPEVFVVLPVLHEADSLEDAVDFFTSLISEGDSVVIVTSDREIAAAGAAGTSTSTVDLAQSLANRPAVIHGHLADSAAFKADQLNYAARLIAEELAAHAETALMVVYDIDSRPDPTSIDALRSSAAQWPHVSLFQQSSRFLLEKWDVRLPRYQRILADAGALRANRFVMSTELPRLLARRPTSSFWQRMSSRLSYGHLVGHGLGIRVHFLLSHPMPDHTPMEDMFYGFQMAVRAAPIVPLHKVDSAEVPSSPAEQFRQLERWFLGPSRVGSYIRHPNTPRTPATAVVAAMAALITVEWLTAVAALPVTVASSGVLGSKHQRLLVATVVAVGCELVSAELTLGSAEDGRRRRAMRVAAYPIAASAFGLAGWSSIVKHLTGRPVAHKTSHTG